MSPSPSTKICPVCRTPNLPTNPICTRCNYQFLAARESTLRPLNESVLPPPMPGPTPSAMPPLPPMPPPPPAQPEVVEFEDAPMAAPQPVASPAAPAPLAPAAGKGKRGARRAGRDGFPRVPKSLEESKHEALRYDAMQKTAIGVVVLIVTTVALPFVLRALSIGALPIGIGGLVSYVLLVFFFMYARGVGRVTRKPISGVEKEALGRVRGGGVVLLLVPFGGSAGGQIGLFFQTSPMHPIYYLIVGLGIAITLSGITGLKERYSYYSVFEFGWAILLLQPLPALLPGNLGNTVFVNAYWFQQTMLFLALGFFGIAYALRRMRAGQYDALEHEVAEGQKALSSRQWDSAIPHFDRAVTIAHSLYSDKLFKATKTGQRALPADYYVPWVGKATALALSGRGPKALTILDIILEVDGANAQLWMNKGEVLLSLKRPAEAYIAFETAQRLNPALPGLAQEKARALELLRRRIE